MQPYRCTTDTTTWFTRRGVAVIYPVRRGYGPTGGRFAEGDGPCDDPDFVDATDETARDIAAAMRYAAALPYAKPGGLIAIGHSGGGWGVVAYNAQSHDETTAIINMAGGRGTHLHDGDVSGHCAVRDLLASAGHYGKTATTPMLWVYARSDEHFPPEYAAALHDAFVDGGGKATLAEVETGTDRIAHGMFLDRGASRLWGPPVAAYLRSRFPDFPVDVRKSSDSSKANPAPG